MACRPERLFFCRALPLVILGVSVWSLAVALVAEYGFDLEPCMLCLYQRVPFVVAGVLAVLGLTVFRLGDGPALTSALAGVAFLVGAGIAVYHVGVEQHWWVSSCSADSMSMSMSFDDFKASLNEKIRKPCDEINWTVMGLSIATWNVFYSGALGLATLVAARILGRG